MVTDISEGYASFPLKMVGVHLRVWLGAAVIQFTKELFFR